jgi:hypothetical protein
MNVPLTDSLLVALSNLVDDAQSETRRPSHSDLKFTFEKSNLLEGDPLGQGQNVGKTKRVMSTLSWAMEHAPEAGARFVPMFISMIRGHGGFRETSQNYVGRHAFENAVITFGNYQVDVARAIR